MSLPTVMETVLLSDPIAKGKKEKRTLLPFTLSLEKTILLPCTVRPRPFASDTFLSDVVCDYVTEIIDKKSAYTRHLVGGP